MNNAVGYAPTEAPRRAALGTDSIDGDMLAEARAAYLKMRDTGRSDAMEATVQLLAGGHRLGAALFGLPFGKLDGGAPADLVVLDYTPVTYGCWETPAAFFVRDRRRALLFHRSFDLNSGKAAE
jgi:cytosine/adenosine deaminase-related metal-dependent hydrolase